MAERTTKKPEADEAVGNGPAQAITEPNGPATLDEAFMTLREALMAHYQDRNMNHYLRCDELGIIFANGNKAFGWQHIIFILEQALGVTLRVS